MLPVLAAKRRAELLHLRQTHEIAPGPFVVLAWHRIAEKNADRGRDTVFVAADAGRSDFIFGYDAGECAVRRSVSENRPLRLHVSGNFDW